jgi:CarD family transcriptional regulator|tara:strand:- start:22641 stop:23165 length:525 start_codon:yes stop_codon:yes gene_type:complete
MCDNITVYKVGDNAVYPSHGLVKIVSIEKKQIGDQELNFLILQVIESDITVMIPEGSVQARGLRPVAKKNELKNLWSLIKGKAKYKSEDNLSWNKRYRNYTEKLKSGNIIMAGEVFREINDISKKKELSFGEQKILQIAFNRIVKELSASLKTKEEDVYLDIKKLLIKPDSINI